MSARHSVGIVSRIVVLSVLVIFQLVKFMSASCVDRNLLPTCLIDSTSLAYYMFNRFYITGVRLGQVSGADLIQFLILQYLAF